MTALMLVWIAALHRFLYGAGGRFMFVRLLWAVVTTAMVFAAMLDFLQFKEV